jgi:ribose transport system ATP-binding protein
LQRGISLIHQELNLADNLDIGANIFLGREPGRLGLIDKGRIRDEARLLLQRIGLDVDPDTLVRELSIGHQQLVEIAKALSTNARVLIMDEPTSSLSQHETEQLFRVIRDLRHRGVCIVYISHRLGEVKQLADRVVVLRDGENAGNLTKEQITHDAMVKLMVGRDISQFYARRSHAPGQPALEVLNLRTQAQPAHQLSLTVRAGEIIGLAGLVGAGRSEMLRVLFGIDRALGGVIRVGGVTITPSNPWEAIQAGIALVPEDRKQQGLVVEFTVRNNIGLAGLRRNRHILGFLNFSAASDAIRRKWSPP